MEVAIGEAAVTMAIDKAVTLFSKEFARLSGVNEKIKSLNQNLEVVYGYLRDAEASNHTEREGVRSWLGQLENIAYDIEDLLDECDAEATLRPGGNAKLRKWRRSRLHDGLCLVSDCFLSCCISNPTPVSFRREIAKKFESVEQRLEKSINMGSSLGLVNLSGPSQLHQCTRSSRETSPFREEGSLFVGREEKIKEIKVKLLASVDRVDDSSSNCSSSISRGNPCEAKISVVAIVGCGGMGKTTLAQAIFDDKEVEVRFTMRKWVFVGEDFDTKRLIRDIIGDEGTSNNMTSLSGLQAGLKERVREHRFLIIWDDVWNKNPTKWNDLCVPLSYAREGSVIVVTTRNLDVAKTYDGPVSIHELDRLSNDHCWRIFERRAFRGVKSERDPRLEGIGRKIVEKLKGVPLAASMIGGFLGAHLHDVRKWEWILNSTEWPLTAEGSIVDEVIDLSYRHLPPHLRLCFAYCGIFPKDFWFDRKDLVLMWMAQGYVKPEKGRELEDAGDDYFEDLYRSSFFQFINERYVMHDIIHDYAQKVFKSGKRVINDNDRKENCMASAGDQEEQVRHLSFSCISLQATDVEKLCKFHKLRTLHLLCWGEEAIDLDFLAELKYLRVLQLQICGCSELPKSTKSNWKLLKYLDIGKTGIICMPDDLVSGTLCNLQTLKLNHYYWSAGEGVSKLVNLRHIHGNPHLISTIPGLGKLTALQELEVFDVARSDGRKIVELKGLNCLRGSLRIEPMEEVESKGEAEVACLKDKVHLEGLHLRWYLERSGVDDTLESEVLEALSPPPNLKDLYIEGTCGIHLPTWMMEPSLPLSNLVSLSLVRCTGWEHLPPLGRLPYLKHLRIWSASRVKKVGTGFLGINDRNILDGNQCHHQQAGEVFRSLETLEFVEMQEWEVWDAAGILEEETRTPDQGCGQVVVFFPSLRRLALSECPKLKGLPVEIMLRLTTLRDLSILHCSSLASSSLVEDVRTSGCHTWPLERFDTDNRSLLQWLLQHPQKTKRFPFLRHLAIAHCHELISFTDVEEDGLKHLISLKELEIMGCQDLRYLPSSLHALPSLQVFRLAFCPEIQCLPDGGLPPSLLVFRMIDCPLLAQRCRVGGADYLKTQGIKDLYIL